MTIFEELLPSEASLISRWQQQIVPSAIEENIKKITSTTNLIVKTAESCKDTSLDKILLDDNNYMQDSINKVPHNSPYSRGNGLKYKKYCLQLINLVE